MLCITASHHAARDHPSCWPCHRRTANHIHLILIVLNTDKHSLYSVLFQGKLVSVQVASTSQVPSNMSLSGPHSPMPKVPCKRATGVVYDCRHHISKQLFSSSHSELTFRQKLSNLMMMTFLALDCPAAFILAVVKKIHWSIGSRKRRSGNQSPAAAQELGLNSLETLPHLSNTALQKSRKLYIYIYNLTIQQHGWPRSCGTRATVFGDSNFIII